jgi:hypothetical protein
VAERRRDGDEEQRQLELGAKAKWSVRERGEMVRRSWWVVLAFYRGRVGAARGRRLPESNGR